MGKSRGHRSLTYNSDGQVRSAAPSQRRQRPDVPSFPRGNNGSCAYSVLRRSPPSSSGPAACPPADEITKWKHCTREEGAMGGNALPCYSAGRRTREGQRAPVIPHSAPSRNSPDVNGRLTERQLLLPKSRPRSLQDVRYRAPFPPVNKGSRWPQRRTAVCAFHVVSDPTHFLPTPPYCPPTF